MSTLLPCYVLLDLETTGATPTQDRITEIGLIRYENGIEVGRWNTLINPEVSISLFIQRLTGITQDMVDHAPTFAQVCETLLQWLDQAVLCAHNVRFDYGFLKNEFKRIGVTFQKKLLCTVKLSRKLYPQHHSHSLNAIVERFQLICTQRHRAMGDTEMMAAFIEIAIREFGESTVQETVKTLLKQQATPTGLDHLDIHAIPETCGVYLFHGDSALLYVGKSVSLRSRVFNHFQGDHRSAKEMRIAQEIKRVEYRITSGELGALLLESRLIKEYQPIHNRQLRRERQLCAWQVSSDPNAKPLVTLINDNDIDWRAADNVYGTFKTKRQAVEVLNKLADEYGLCDKALGLEKGAGVCFSHQLKHCKGLCAGKESAESHRLRLLTALSGYKLLAWPFDGRIGIREHNPDNDMTEMHVFDQWCHLGTVRDHQEFDEIATHPHFDRDTYRYLLTFLNRKDVEVIALHG
ncbi:MAG: exonuclease domain-containing protein [Nitrosomonas sp.]|uniref:3'-5' exonuclease family protein n=1 Tax=Nitrosomonas sp. TaxID=42353 RepID=UPI002731EB14|nr:3'-5' exonuclease family protein [Nitrosomonas sp.]MDP1788572.1 exonuclease domain-containing protein [Nitrosomonas sp.]MDP3282273.1 exonuclease domain-containing protein [Nitrosomonas sp.]